MTRKIFRFTIIGLINSFFGYSIYAFLILLNINYEVAITLSTLIGVGFNFSSYRLYLFGDKFNICSLLKYFFSYFIIYLINLFCLNLLTIKINPYYSQLICFPFIVLLNWTFLNFWIFKKN